jgi:SAM-dependent methyltransferase
MDPRPALRPILERLIGEGADAFEVLFEREHPVAVDSLRVLIGAGGVDRLEAAGLLELDRSSARALVRVDRAEGLLVASDLRAHRLQRAFVVGPGPASLLLARHVGRPARGPILDLGTGSGIQGLLAGGGGQRVSGLDINPRAVEFARFNALLNGRAAFTAEVGDFLTGDPDRRHHGAFGTVIANPPFVLSPAAEVTYRDRPLPADEVGAKTVEGAARSLARGGRGYVLCNWIDRGGDWSTPVRAWLAGTRIDAAVVRISSLGAAAYAAVWTRDLGAAERLAAEQRWRLALVAEGIERIHLGVVALARPRLPRLRGRFSAWDGPRDPDIRGKVEHALAG